MNGGRRGHVYAIDPDGPGGVQYFAVQCDFETDKDIGITIVSIDKFYWFLVSENQWRIQEVLGV